MMTRITFSMFAALFALTLSGCATDSEKIRFGMANYDTDKMRGLINKDNVNSGDVLGNTPLILAISYQKPEIAKMLILEKGADVNAATRSGIAPLHNAASIGQTEIAELLIEKGAKVNGVSSAGDTPLLWAAVRGHTKIASLLINKGANVNSQNSANDSPLSLAAAAGHTEVANLLINKGANVNSQNSGGGTPLHNAAINGKLEIVKLLVSHDANTTLQTNVKSPVGAGKTALDLARAKNFTEICNVLLAPSPQLVAKLNALVEARDVPGLKAYLDAHPDALSSIKDESLRLLLTGPADLRITDIAQLVKNQRKDALIIARINSASAPYKSFSDSEITELNKMGISDDVVAAMITVTAEYNKEQKRIAEQQRVVQPAQAAQHTQAQQPVPAVTQAESNTPAECLQLIAGLKACDLTGGLMKAPCKSLVRSQSTCTAVEKYMR